MGTSKPFDSRVRAVDWADGKLRLLDQRRLPESVEYLDYEQAPEVATAITDMVVRGAPAIGVTAAYAVVLAARSAYAQEKEDWRVAIKADLQLLAAARPTAINLHWALETMTSFFNAIEGDPEEPLLSEAIKIHDQDIAANKAMGDLGAEFIGDAQAVMTHCNAGALATGGYGTALGVIRSAYGQGRINRVYAGETRPWLQGARLTAWELQQDNIPVTLISDSAASHLFSQGEISWVIVGADRIAANGDVANKIGTYQLAIAARYHAVKFMVVAPLSTIDLETESASDIPIEIRSENEVLGFSAAAIAPENVSAWNPAFDLTPADLIDVIVTEKGLVNAPNKEKIQALFRA